MPARVAKQQGQTLKFIEVRKFPILFCNEGGWPCVSGPFRLSRLDNSRRYQNQNVVMLRRRRRVLKKSPDIRNFTNVWNGLCLRHLSIAWKSINRQRFPFVQQGRKFNSGCLHRRDLNRRPFRPCISRRDMLNIRHSDGQIQPHIRVLHGCS